MSVREQGLIVVRTLPTPQAIPKQKKINVRTDSAVDEITGLTSMFGNNDSVVPNENFFSWCGSEVGRGEGTWLP